MNAPRTLPKSQLTVVVALLSLFSSAVAFAQSSPGVLVPAATLERIAHEFPPPPALGSAADEADIRAVAKAQHDASPQLIAAATKIAHCTLGDLYGPETRILTNAQVRILEPLFSLAFENADALTNTIKPMHNRVRPAERTAEELPADVRIQAFVSIPNNTSYPSGHTAIGELTGRILTLFFPRSEGKILNRAKAIGYGRVVGGMHHPLDVKGGLRVGDLVFREILKSARFRNMVAKARVQLARLEPAKASKALKAPTVMPTMPLSPYIAAPVPAKIATSIF